MDVYTTYHEQYKGITDHTSIFNIGPRSSGYLTDHRNTAVFLSEKNVTVHLDYF